MLKHLQHALFANDFGASQPLKVIVYSMADSKLSKSLVLSSLLSSCANAATKALLSCHCSLSVPAFVMAAVYTSCTASLGTPAEAAAQESLQLVNATASEQRRNQHAMASRCTS